MGKIHEAARTHFHNLQCGGCFAAHLSRAVGDAGNGFLHSGSPETYQVTSVLKSLNEAGYIEGQNIEIDHQSERGQYERLPTLAAHLLNRRVALIVAMGFPAAATAKSATSTIPIVFVTGGDPVEFGLVASLNRPGGNVTGVNQVLGALGPKSLELLRGGFPGQADRQRRLSA